MGIRAANKSNGNSPGLGRMLVREIIGKVLSGIILGLGYFWAIFDKDAQAWHDKIAGAGGVAAACASEVTRNTGGSQVGVTPCTDLRAETG